MRQRHIETAKAYVLPAESCMQALVNNMISDTPDLDKASKDSLKIERWLLNMRREILKAKRIKVSQ